MKAVPKVGETGEARFRVGPGHAIDFAEGGMPAVLSTPWLIWFLEHAAREAVLPHLEAGESTVGVYVEVEHLAATPLGEEVHCRARVVHVAGHQITFQVEARDGHEQVARGLHKLRVILVDRFAKTVLRKTRQGP